MLFSNLFKISLFSESKFCISAGTFIRYTRVYFTFFFNSSPETFNESKSEQIVQKCIHGTLIFQIFLQTTMAGPPDFCAVEFTKKLFFYQWLLSFSVFFINIKTIINIFGNKVHRYCIFLAFLKFEMKKKLI